MLVWTGWPLGPIHRCVCVTSLRGYYYINLLRVNWCYFAERRIAPPFDVKSFLFEAVVTCLVAAVFLLALYIWWRYKKFGLNLPLYDNTTFYFDT